MYINYLMFDGVNDSASDARQLAELLKPLDCWLKVSRYNAIPELELEGSSDEVVARFREVCEAEGISLYSFISQCVDVGGGCGQLRMKVDRAIDC